jgi:hypothetical protein
MLGSRSPPSHKLRPVSDARESVYGIDIHSPGPGGRWFKSTRPLTSFRPNNLGPQRWSRSTWRRARRSMFQIHLSICPAFFCSADQCVNLRMNRHQETIAEVARRAPSRLCRLRREPRPGTSATCTITHLYYYSESYFRNAPKGSGSTQRVVSRAMKTRLFHEACGGVEDDVQGATCCGLAYRGTFLKRLDRSRPIPQITDPANLLDFV